MSVAHGRSHTVLHVLVAGSQSHEFVLLLVIVALAILVGSVESTFWSLATAFSVARNSLVTAVFALAFFMILIVGGIDVSFAAIGIFSGYMAAKLAVLGYYNGGVLEAFVLAGFIGLLLGAVNATAVVGLRLPVLIATLATRSIFVGVLLTFVGSYWYNFLPGELGTFANAELVRVPMGRGSIGLHPLVIPVVILAIALSIILSRTMWGRGLYAMGGDAEAARRAGFPVRRLSATAICLAGVLAGLGGMVHVSLGGNANPYELVGGEMGAIAAVVLGGASIFGGKGTVLGAVLGAVLVTLIQFSMVSLGVPAAGSQIVVGMFLLIGISAQLMRRRRPSRSMAVLDPDHD